MTKSDPNFRQRLDDWFDTHLNELLSDLRELIAIRSVEGAPSAGKPYGDGPAQALSKASQLLEQYGFTVYNFENRVITADLNEKTPALGILAHLDVVEEGTGWNTDPFELTITENGGMLLGRGVSDDKGPAVAALYAMRAVRELFPELSAGCRLILGSAEETGMDDLKHYSAAHKYPPYVFSPDADYPLINTEIGRAHV